MEFQKAPQQSCPLIVIGQKECSELKGTFVRYTSYISKVLTGAFTVSKSCILCNVSIDGTPFNRHRWKIQVISFHERTAPPRTFLQAVLWWLHEKAIGSLPKKQLRQQQRKPRELKLYFHTKASTTAANAFKPVKNWRLEMAQAKRSWKVSSEKSLSL